MIVFNFVLILFNNWHEKYAIKNLTIKTKFRFNEEKTCLEIL